MSDSANNGLSYNDLKQKIEEIRNTLQQAESLDREQQEQSEKIRNQARIEAIRIVDEAHQQAEELREKTYIEGHKDALREAEEAESQRDQLAQEVDDLKSRKEELISRLEQISAQMKTMIAENQPEEAAPVEEPAQVEEPAPALVEAVESAPVEEVESAPVEEEKPAVVPAPAAVAVPVVAEEPAPAAVETPAEKAAPVETAAAVKEEPAKQEKKAEKAPHYGRKILIAVLITIAAAAAIIFGFIVGFARVSDDGMKGTAAKGDIVVYNKIDKSADAGNVVLVKDKNGTKYLRYIAGQEGDTVDVDTFDNRLFINDLAYAEDYESDRDGDISYPYELGKSEIYVLCEDRDAPSHEGLYNESDIAGNVTFVFHR